MNFEHVLCDFDGTLVDSSDGIISSLRQCIERAGLPVRVEPSRDLIGPPLRSMIATVMGADHTGLADIETAYRCEYDEVGYLSTRPFPGIPEALLALIQNDVLLHIVTNKRLVPVRQILDMLNWNCYFASVCSLDSTFGAASKSDVVRSLLQALDASPNRVLMVGDSLDDRIAAEANGISFAWVTWGYGRDPSLRAHGRLLGAACDLVSLVLTDGAL
jgi:phosphoglycolate phosphatase